MKQKYLRDQRGVAMLLELVLVVAVLSLAGLAVYQSSQHSKTASEKTVPSGPTTAVGLAASASAIAEQESASDVALSADAEASANELTATDNDVSDLGGTADASF